jgi:hypothetical protein
MRSVWHSWKRECYPIWLSRRRVRGPESELSTTVGKSRGSSSRTCMYPGLRKEGH